MIFKNREEAGFLLSKKLKNIKGDLLAVAIPRGGVIVGKIIALNLKIPLDIVVVRKIGAPNNPELAIGAVGPDKITYLDRDLIKRLNIKKYQVLCIMYQVEKEQLEREKKLRGEKPYGVKGKTIILVDDGVATGATAIAAAEFLRKAKAKKIILAIPVIAHDTLLYIKKYFDEVVFLEKPIKFYAVGQFYREFPQVEDDKVVEILVK